MIKNYLYIDDTLLKGKGVFTKKPITAGTVVELSPVIVLHQNDRIHIDKTLLHDYIFEWGNNKETCCMALGYIPMYNHSYASNCEYFMDYDNATIYVKAVKNINAKEELTINYNGDWNDAAKVWFDAK
jgi:uncharacterized protein